MYYTWDDPAGRRFLRWSIRHVSKISNNKLIDISKAREHEFDMIV